MGFIAVEGLQSFYWDKLRWRPEVDKGEPVLPWKPIEYTEKVQINSDSPWKDPEYEEVTKKVPLWKLPPRRPRKPKK